MKNPMSLIKKKSTCVALLAFAFAPAFAQSDIADPAFSSDGEYLSMLRSDYLWDNDFVDEAGSITYWLNEPTGTGTTNYILRVLADGTPDLTLGLFGIKALESALIENPCDLPGEENCHTTTDITKAISLPGGKFLIGGMSYESDPIFSSWFVAQYLADGTLDASFSDNGVIFGPIGKIHSVTGLGIDADGKILVLIEDYSSERSEIMRLNADGSFDDTFGIDGLSILPDFTINCNDDIKTDASGNIYLAGNNSMPGDIVRLTSDGALDMSFGDEGRVAFDTIDFHIEAFRIDDAGIVAAGEIELFVPSQFCLLRFDLDGNPDLSFSGDGHQFYIPDSITPCPNYISSAAVISEANEFYISLNENAPDHYTSPIIFKFDADGNIDLSFSELGWTWLSDAINRDIKLDADQRLIVSSEQYDALFGDHYIQIHRLLTDGTITGTEALLPCMIDEVCNGIDDNENGIVDEDLPMNVFYADLDGDSYGNPEAPAVTCALELPGYVMENTDCDDTNALINSGAEELIDGLDNNCNGLVDEGTDVHNMQVQFAIYPNPTDGILYIETNNSTEGLLTIVNATGQEVLRYKTPLTGPIIDLTSLPDGMYIVNVCYQNVCDAQLLVLSRN
ncbi:MAG TPA: MopE-related protein [Chitinophagales bacterium]|nr:MopE-related protein [Chitinophagales bacterium]